MCPGLELDRPPGDPDRTAAAGDGAPRSSVGCDVLERPVVAGGDERVVDGRVEPSSGPLPRVEREVDHGEQVVAGLEASRAVQRR